MFRKLNNWLDKYFPLWSWDSQQGPIHLLAIFITIILVFVWYFCKLDWVILWQSLAGIVTLGLPGLAAIISLIKKQSWNPWYWFPSLAGVIVGGIVAIGLSLIFFAL